MLMYLMIVCTGVVLLPTTLAQGAKQSAWIVPLLLPAFTGFLAVWGVCKLGRRFPGLTLVQYSEVVLGKILGKGIAASFILYLVFLNITVMREATAFLSIALLTVTPGPVLTFSIVLLGTYLALKGIEVIARMVQFVLPIFLTSFILVMVLTIGDVEFGSLLPLFEGGVLPIVKSSLVPASLFGQISLLALLLPVITKPREIRRKAVLTIIAAAGFLSAVILAVLLVFGPDVAGSYFYSFWSLARFVQVGRYIQRVESIVTILWVTGIIMKVTLLFYLSSLAASQLFGMKNYKPALYFLAPVQGALAIFPGISSAKLLEIQTISSPPVGLAFELLLPFFLLITAVLLKKRSTG